MSSDGSAYDFEFDAYEDTDEEEGEEKEEAENEQEGQDDEKEEDVAERRAAAEAASGGGGDGGGGGVRLDVTDGGAAWTTLADMLGISLGEAADLLEEAGGDLEKAMNKHFGLRADVENGGDGDEDGGDRFGYRSGGGGGGRRARRGPTGFAALVDEQEGDEAKLYRNPDKPQTLNPKR